MTREKAPPLASTPARRRPWKTVRNAMALARMTLKLSFRDRRAFFFSLGFPLVFLVIYGVLAAREAPDVLQDLIARVVGLSIMTGAFFGQGMGLAIQRERGMLRRYRLTPLGAAGLLGGTALAGLVMLALTLAIQLFLWRFQFHARLIFQPGLFVLVATVAALSMASLGLIIAAVASTMQEAQILFQIAFMGSLLLSDLTVPLEMFPRAVQRIAVFLPPTHMTRVLHDVFMGSRSLGPDVPALAALSLMAVAAFTMAARLFRWERDDPLPRRAKLSALLALLPVLAFGLWQNAHGTVRPRPMLPPPPPAVAAPSRKEGAAVSRPHGHQVTPLTRPPGR